MPPPSITIDTALCLLRNADTDFLIGYKNSIPDPRYLTSEQKEVITPAVLGIPEPHKFIHLHFRKVDDWKKSKQIIMHRYPNARDHDWDNQDDINKLNVFRIAAVTLGRAGIDISEGERCWSFVPKSLRRMWFPALEEFIEELEAEQTRAAIEDTTDEEADEEADGVDDEDDENDAHSSGHSDESENEPDVPEAQNNPVHLVWNPTQAWDDTLEEQQGSAQVEGGINFEEYAQHNGAIDGSDRDDLSSDGVRDRQVIQAYLSTQTGFSSSFPIPVGSPILNPALNSVSTHNGSPILYSPFIGPQPFNFHVEVESLDLSDNPTVIGPGLAHIGNIEGYGGSMLL